MASMTHERNTHTLFALKVDYRTQLLRFHSSTQNYIACLLPLVIPRAGVHDPLCPHEQMTPVKHSQKALEIFVMGLEMRGVPTHSSHLALMGPITPDVLTATKLVFKPTSYPFTPSLGADRARVTVCVSV